MTDVGTAGMTEGVNDSFRSQPADIPRICRDLKAQFVIEGAFVSSGNAMPKEGVRIPYGGIAAK